MDRVADLRKSYLMGVSCPSVVSVIENFVLMEAVAKIVHLVGNFAEGIVVKNIVQLVVEQKIVVQDNHLLKVVEEAAAAASNSMKLWLLLKLEKRIGVHFQKSFL